jgi:hypothetical protein
MYGKCPACEGFVTQLISKTIPIKDGNLTWTGVVFLCPLCSSILGSGIDPVAAKTDTIDQLKKEIREVLSAVKKISAR